MRVLVVNAGSSSLKLDLLDGDDHLGSETLEAPGPSLDADELEAAVGRLGPVDAVGHRVVHGGSRFTGPARIDAEVRAAIEALGSLAPLHQQKALQGLDAVSVVLPDAPAVASFDTAFHHGLPLAARTYPLPRVWRERWDLRRFGAHGLSVQHAARRASELTGRPLDALRTVVCHLGSGASVTAVHGGRSVDTTMGLTPLEGVVMGTRSGTVDPGLVLWLQREAGLSADEVQDGLEHRSGLLGLAGTADMREVQARAARAGGPDRAAGGDVGAGGTGAHAPGAERGAEDDAALALGVAVHRLRAAVAATAAAMGGLDALVLTGGVGEHAGALRTRTLEGLGFLGVAVRETAPTAGDGATGADEDEGDHEISAVGSSVRTLVVAAREDLVIARETRAVLGG